MPNSTMHKNKWNRVSTHHTGPFGSLALCSPAVLWMSRALLSPVLQSSQDIESDPPIPPQVVPGPGLSGPSVRSIPARGHQTTEKGCRGYISDVIQAHESQPLLWNTPNCWRGDELRSSRGTLRSCHWLLPSTDPTLSTARTLGFGSAAGNTLPTS